MIYVRTGGGWHWFTPGKWGVLVRDRRIAGVRFGLQWGTRWVLVWRYRA